jgi:plasmid stability protein
MADVLVRNLGEKTHRELKRRARSNGRSVNAEIVAVLDKEAEKENKTDLWAELESIKKKYLLDGEEFDFQVERDKTPAGTLDFSGPEFDVHETK